MHEFTQKCGGTIPLILNFSTRHRSLHTQYAKNTRSNWPHNQSGHFEENEKSISLAGDRTPYRSQSNGYANPAAKQWPGVK
jgi:hypothetical protein